MAIRCQRCDTVFLARAIGPNRSRRVGGAVKPPRREKPRHRERDPSGGDQIPQGVLWGGVAGGILLLATVGAWAAYELTRTSDPEPPKVVEADPPPPTRKPVIDDREPAPPVTPQPPADDPEDVPPPGGVEPERPEPPKDKPPPEPVDPEPEGTPRRYPETRFVLKPMPFEGEETELRLPGRIGDLCLAGGGRFLVFLLPEESEITVFDLNEARLIARLPVPAPDVLITAGMEQLIAVHPPTRTIHRWKVGTFEPERSATLPVADTPTDVCMGHASAGPLGVITLPDNAVSGPGKAGMFARGKHPGQGRLFDPVTLAELTDSIDTSKARGRVRGQTLAASPDGGVFAFADDYDKRVHAIRHHRGAWVLLSRPVNQDTHVMPAADGDRFYDRSGVRGADLSPMLGDSPIPDPSASFYPAPQGRLFWGYSTVQDPNYPGRQIYQPLLSVFRPGDLEPTATLPIELEPTAGRQTPEPRLDRTDHYMLLPEAEVLARIASSGRALKFRRFRTSELPVDADRQGTCVITAPPAYAVRGATFEYQARGSGSGSDRFRLESGPEGMTVSPDGLVRWDVPADFAERSASVRLALGNVVQGFDLAVPDRPRQLRVIDGLGEDVAGSQPVGGVISKDTPDLVRFELVPPDLAGDSDELPLPTKATDLRLAGGGRFVILRMAGGTDFSVFDTAAARSVKEITAPDDPKLLFAANMDSLLFILPTERRVERWSLRTLTKTWEGPLPDRVQGELVHAAMGSGGHGPLLLAWSDPVRMDRASTAFFDPYTLKELRTWSSSDTKFTADQTVRVSTDGSLFTADLPGDLNDQGVFFRAGEIRTVQGALPAPSGRVCYSAEFADTIAGGQTVRLPAPAASAIPAVTGDTFYLRMPKQLPTEFVSFTLMRLGAPDSIARLDPLPVARKDVIPIDRRVMLIPEAKLLIVFPKENNRLILKKFDPFALLEASGQDYMVVTSPPPGYAVKGRPFSHQIEIRSNAEGVRCELASGPEGMALSEDNVLAWPSPESIDPVVAARLKLTDPAGRVEWHTVQIPLVEPDAIPPEASEVIPAGRQPPDVGEE